MKKYNVKKILLGALFWIGSYLWLIFEGNQAPFQVYKAFSKALILLDIPHSESTVVILTEFLIPTILFAGITASSVFLYNNTLKIMLAPPPKKPAAPVPGPGGAIVINQHFGGAAPKPAAEAAKK